MKLTAALIDTREQYPYQFQMPSQMRAVSINAQFTFASTGFAQECGLFLRPAGNKTASMGDLKSGN